MEEKQNPRIPNGMMPPEMTAQGIPQGAPQGVSPQGFPPQGFPPNKKPPFGMRPPKGMGPHGGMPPQGMGPNGSKEEVFLGVEEREEMLAIMPDFKRWQSVFLKLYIAVVGVTVVVKLLVYAYLRFYLKSSDTDVSYFVFSVILPLVLNILIYIIGKGMMSRMHEMDMRKNFIPVFMMLLLNYVMCLVPRHIFFVMMIGFAIPICMTTIFGHKKMCSLVTRISQVGIILASVKQIIFIMHYNSAVPLPVEQSDALWFIPQALIVFSITTIVGVVAQSTLGMTEGQREKLLSYTRSIKEAKQRAEAASIAKSTFLANMSHEIRTPINAILGMNEMILRENTNKQIEEYALNVQSAGNSLLYQVNDVLDISKIESGKLEIVETNYEMSSFIHDCYNMVVDRAQKKGLQLVIDSNPTLPSKMYGDEVRLRQVVTNFLSNAAKYTERGSITLSVNGHKDDDNKFVLEISVKDTGMGIKEEDLSKLFDQFSRFDMEKNRNIEGTGLGLAIAKRLVDLMHGELKVQSIYGVGSMFTVTIPQKVIDSTPMGDYAKRYNEEKERNSKDKKNLRAPDAKILIVDDVPMNLEVVSNLLKKTQIQVDTALSGKLCLEKTSQKVYDLIFMDHMMPEMDGVETYAKIKSSEDSLNKKTPVIMLTANAISGIKEKFLQEGFADYLSKPVVSSKLEAMIIKYLPEDKVILESPGQKVQQKPKAPAAPVVETPSPAPQTEIVLEDESGNEENQALLKKLLKIYPNVDLNTGLAYCGSDSEIYVSALKSFCGAAKIDEINSLYSQKDTANYQILVHGVKSSSLGIGFAHLSEKARELEDAARQNDWAFLDANHADFIAEYKKAVDAITSLA